MDLVQTSEAAATFTRNTALPILKESEATPSPVLPDIVMEAPLNLCSP